MKKLGAFSVLIVLAAGPAMAADMRVKAPPPPVVPVWSWTGFYIGGDLGGRWSNSTWNTTCIEVGLPNASCPNNTANPVDSVRFLNGNPAKFNSVSARVGGHAGYNWQLNPQWVVGIEGDIAWANSSSSIVGIPGTESAVIAGAPGLDRSTVKQDWDGSIRGRVGFLATPRVMVYGTGGIAFTNASASATCGTPYQVGWCTLPANIGTTSTLSSNLTGWTAGLGVEGVISGNWLGRAEWRHSDYGSITGTMFGAPASLAVGDGISTSVKVRSEILSVGISYKFGPAPLVAKY
jgi:outer membrane immunogenic protein